MSPVRCNAAACRKLARHASVWNGTACLRVEWLSPSAGCFHFDGLMQQLHEDFRLYALDFVGQGRSWPERPEGLAYSVDLWSCQVCDFIRFAWTCQSSLAAVITPTSTMCWHSSSLTTCKSCRLSKRRSEIGEPVYLAGNSLGGFVAASIATHHPELCRGVRCFLCRLRSQYVCATHHTAG
jgi:pimeloyl-ACP methyl ester carboxylesterase